MRIEFCQVIEPGSFNDHASGILQGDSRLTQFADKKPVAQGIFPEDADFAGFNDTGAIAGLAFQKDDFIFIKSYKVVIHDDLTFPRGYYRRVTMPGFRTFQFILQ